MTQLIINIDSVEVQGNLQRHRYSCSVSIQKPYFGLTDYACIPAFSRDVRTMFGEHGYASGIAMLENLYRLGKYIDENIEFLYNELKKAEMKHLRVQQKIAANNIDGRLGELKQAFKQHIIDGNTYQTELKKIHKSNQDQEFTLENVMRNFFDKNFPFVIPKENQPEVLFIIKAYSNLKH